MSPLKPYQSKIIVLLAQQELLVADLYRLFTGLYPDLREFWNELAKEQMEHATWVEYLYKKVQEGAVHFNEDTIKTYTVESFVKYLEDNLARVKEKAPAPTASSPTCFCRCAKRRLTTAGGWRPGPRRTPPPALRRYKMHLAGVLGYFLCSSLSLLIVL